MYISLKNRIFGLDVIRALAILLVLCSHSTLLLFPNQKHILLTVIQFFGTVGVDLFFVLSGFLIGTIILKQVHKGQTKFKDFCYFWVRRWFRTLPNYFLILLINIALLFVLKGEVLKGIGVGCLLFLSIHVLIFSFGVQPENAMSSCSSIVKLFILVAYWVVSFVLAHLLYTAIQVN